MNIYYTAKDIEELAEKGVTQLELGPNIFLTDFAAETAEQLNIKLVQPGENAPSSPPPAAAASFAPSGGTSRYSKPRGCQHGSSGGSPRPVQANSQAAPAPSQGGSSTTVNRLVDIVGKIIQRGD
jgi:hypothetical protein